MRYIISVFFVTSIFNFTQSQSPTVELRGAWIATVANIDWPSSKKMSAKQQKAEILSILDFYKSHNFNTIFVQVRPSADTFYPSKLEPWSAYLTGKQGKNPGYNPLKFWVKEAHKRGIEIHAWINPYRITNGKREVLHKKHPANIHPDWVINYGGKKYYNPGKPECCEHIINIVEEVVKKYDVDGIHFDDYFYPYPVHGEEFPDSLTYEPFKAVYPNVNDWRRANVNNTIEALNQSIKSIKPTVKFGVSPFGVWRNKSDDHRGSETGAGVTNYDHLYADVLLWLKNGWIDYVTPQLYWSTDHPAVPFKHLTQWWGENAYGKSVYIGHAIYKLNGKNDIWKDHNQMIEQVQIVRDNPLVSGSVYFSHRHFNKNELGFTDSLKTKLYKYPAIIPSMNWLDKQKPNSPSNLRIKKNELKWMYKDANIKHKDCMYAIYVIKLGGERQLVFLSKKKKCSLNKVIQNEKNVYGVQVTAISRSNNESLGSNIVAVEN